MFIKTIDFSKFSSIRVGQKVDVCMLEVGDIPPPKAVIIGHANNLLISPTPPPLMMLSKAFSFIKEERDDIVVGAATPTGKMLSFAKKQNLAGFEFFSKLPGSLGGMVAMNAGVKSYEIFNRLDALKIDNRWITKEEIPHGYRFAMLHGVVTEIRFRRQEGFDHALLANLMALRANQPNLPSAGSVFKNPQGDYAGRLIEAVGLKGVQQGAMQWSEVHANFLVNHGGGCFEDAIDLINLAKERVEEAFGIRLQEEITIL